MGCSSDRRVKALQMIQMTQKILELQSILTPMFVKLYVTCDEMYSCMCQQHQSPIVITPRSLQSDFEGYSSDEFDVIPSDPSSPQSTAVHDLSSTHAHVVSAEQFRAMHATQDPQPESPIKPKTRPSMLKLSHNNRQRLEGTLIPDGISAGDLSDALAALQEPRRASAPTVSFSPISCDSNPSSRRFSFDVPQLVVTPPASPTLSYRPKPRPKPAAPPPVISP